MLIHEPRGRKPRGWIKREVPFSLGYEGRLYETPPGIRYGRKRGSKTILRKKRSRPAFGGYVPMMIRPMR